MTRSLLCAPTLPARPKRPKFHRQKGDYPAPSRGFHPLRRDGHRQSSSGSRATSSTVDAYNNYRTGYTSTVTTTNTWKGEVELVWDITGGFVYRLIAEAMFNANANVGFSGGTTVETVTSRQDYSPAVRAASSGGRDLVTC